MIHNRGAAFGWWKELQPDRAKNHPGDRATLARLRRCATILEVMLEPDAIALFRRCEADDATNDLPLIALAAAVLAHVRETDEMHPARRVGPKVPIDPKAQIDSKTAVLKPLRFRTLIEARTGDERLTAFRRLVALAGGTINVALLVDALLRWTDERKREWVFAYWDAGPPPNSNPPRPANALVKDPVA